jgi:hypothetical protein
MRWVLISLGAALMTGGLLYDPSVPGGDVGSITNLGLLAEKQLIFGLGSVLFLAGIILIGAHRVVIAVRGPTEVEASDLGAASPGYTVGPGFGRAKPPGGGS